MPRHCPMPFFALMMLGLAACAGEDAVTPAAPGPTAAPVAAAPAAPAPDTQGENQVALAMMASHRLSDQADITFVGAVDTRCPPQAHCVWAGEAHALFLLRSRDRPDVLLTLPLKAAANGDPTPRRRLAEGFGLHLLSLEPAPAAGVVVANEAYVAGLHIEPAPTGEPQAPAQPSPPLEHDMPDAPPGVAMAGTREEIPGFDAWATRTVGLHERVMLSDTSALTLAGVIDSRCPADAACATAGEAHALFLLTIEGEPAQALALQWSARFRHDAAHRWKTAAGHRVFLESIDPHPESDTPTPAVSYRATLRIEGLSARPGPAPGDIR